MKTVISFSVFLVQTVRSLLAWPLEVLSPLCYMPDSIAGLVGEEALSADLLSSPAEASR